eukprot:11409447-Alexandrium_andersonii.AAC.1
MTEARSVPGELRPETAIRNVVRRRWAPEPGPRAALPAEPREPGAGGGSPIASGDPAPAKAPPIEDPGCASPKALKPLTGKESKRPV